MTWWPFAWRRRNCDTLGHDWGEWFYEQPGHWQTNICRRCGEWCFRHDGIPNTPQEDLEARVLAERIRVTGKRFWK